MNHLIAVSPKRSTINEQRKTVPEITRIEVRHEHKETNSMITSKGFFLVTITASFSVLERIEHHRRKRMMHPYSFVTFKEDRRCWLDCKMLV
jgi:hypothetical protein